MATRFAFANPLKAALGLAAGLTLAFGLSGCGGSSTTPHASTQQALSTAENDVCVTPSTNAQTVSVATSDVTATIGFAAFASSAAGCDEVRLATGSDVEIAQASLRSPLALVRDATGTAPTPILTISVGEGIDGHPVFGSEQIVSGMTLNVGPNVTFPDGTYYATISNVQGTISNLSGNVITFTAVNGVLTVSQPTNVPAGQQSLPFIVQAETSAIISVYARGVVPPAPTATPTPIAATPTPVPTGSASPSPGPSGSASPVPSPTASVSPSASPSGSPSPAPTATALPGAYGNPPPSDGTDVGTASYDFPAPGCSGNPGCSASNEEVDQQNGAAYVPVVGGMYGTISFTLSIGSMNIRSVSNDCPADWSVDATVGGSATISIPQSDPYSGTQCEVIFSTLPTGAQGTYYTEDAILQGRDIGAH